MMYNIDMYTEETNRENPGLSDNTGTAYLSNEGRYTVFRYGDYVLRFIGPYSLQRYDHINEWDDGYIAVMTKFSHSSELIEDYIDLRPILENLYMDEDAFLAPIKEVKVDYGEAV